MATVYAVSVHSGGGSMSEGFDSRGAIGFWDNADDAAKVANIIYKRLAAVDKYFADEFDARVVPIEMLAGAPEEAERIQMDAVDALVERLTKEYGFEPDGS